MGVSLIDCFFPGVAIIASSVGVTPRIAMTQVKIVL
jgi:hypothetical protein